jgi:hypothetical protein
MQAERRRAKAQEVDRSDFFIMIDLMVGNGVSD